MPVSKQFPVLDELTLDKVNHALRLLANQGLVAGRMPHSSVKDLGGVTSAGGGSGSGGSSSGGIPSGGFPPGYLDGHGNILASRLAPFIWEQGAASDTWTIPHNLGHNPAYTIFDTGGNVFSMAGESPDLNTLILTANFPVNGTAILF